MDFEEAVLYLDGLTKFGSKPGLERFRALCERFRNPQDQLRCIHAGGTNGKGSTCAMISSILQAEGYRVGAYLSPHVYDMGERVQINGQMISHEDVARLMTRIAPHVASIAADPGLGQPTEFEVKTLLGFLWFVEQQVDYAVVEVGIGGRLDATNVITPLVSVITNIAADHTEILGETLPQIAYEKAGIIKPDAALVTAADAPVAVEVFRSACSRLGVPLIRAGEDEEADVRWQIKKASLEGIKLDITGRRGCYADISLGLPGLFQAANAASAVAAAEVLQDRGVSLSMEAIYRGLKDAAIPGRMAILRHRPTLLVDGAHNPAGAKALAHSIQAVLSYRRLLLVLGMLDRHSVEGVSAALCPMADIVLATAPHHEKASAPATIAQAARLHCADVRIVPGVADAVNAALRQAQPEDLIVVAGSLYNIREVSKRTPF